MTDLTPAAVAAAVLSILFVLLTAAVWEDSRRRRIPNHLVLAGIGVGLGCNALLPQGFGFASVLPGALGFWSALAGAGVGLALLAPLYLLRALGAGDVKLMAMVGAFLGPHMMVGVALATFVLGGILALAQALRRRSLPLLAANLHAMLMSCVFKLALRQLPVPVRMPRSAGRMPYALAIAAGTLACVAMRLAGLDAAWMPGVTA
ncbi:MAG TPA: A24 family peptidase [Noviherbaspirillum sp.]|jgi:prepilin peptidase CpaA|uniref:A24 family peptidase n=1 Tax=Noviherbaspirillum sp. TaxID=1926288 RepID=UPI002F92D092